MARGLTLLTMRRHGRFRLGSRQTRAFFNPAQIVSYVSRHQTLTPRDIIFTGTPEGSILGYPKDQQVWLKAGDKIACNVGKLGELRLALV
jgi:2-keto-4-pentenoate hydratase/2-oxohepta-3-ene-1,7-dioic acid hydratase in catechol pathway